MKVQMCMAFLCFGALWCAPVSGQQSTPAAREELQQLPELALDRKTEWEAKVRVLKSAEGEAKRYGFAFKTPSLVDGPATWLVVWDHAHPDSAPWHVTKPDGSLLEVVSPVTVDLAQYPDLVAKFPQAKSVQRVRVENYRLVKATRYQAVLATESASAPLGISINVAYSGVGARPGEAAQEMNIPEGPIPSKMVLVLVENIRTFRGDAAAISFLDSQFVSKWKTRQGFGDLFTEVWNEAQFGAGKDDPEWASRLNDAAFMAAYGVGDYAQAFSILNNLCATLGSASRFGRLAEVHAIMEDAYRKGGQNMNPSSYPDKGVAIPSLPGIRHREFTMATPYARQSPDGPAAVSLVSSFNPMQAGALINYSYQRMNRGDWQGAMVWAVWIRDWATDKDGKLIQVRNSCWYSATFNLTQHLQSLGYYEEALAMIETAVAAPYGMDYRQRNKITASRLQLDLKRQVGRPDPEMIPKFRELITVLSNHVHFGISSVWSAKIDLAMALFHVGQHAEGDRILEEIIREGSESARWTRLDRWLETGRTDGVEAEMIYLLKRTREYGHKISEMSLYSRYADFLEKTGRLQEALAMRQQAVQLARDFHAFTRLPDQLAKLAALLQKLGYVELAVKAANEARSLVKAGNMPPFTLESLAKHLKGVGDTVPTPPPMPPPSQPDIDLQPHRGLVIPIEGAPWTSYLTLTNPGTAAVRGTLDISLASLNVIEDKETGDLRLELGPQTSTGLTSLPLTLEPGSYRLITVAAGAQHEGDGEVTLTWRAPADGKGKQASLVIDTREKVSGAIIQAGDYQANPFYGVPIHVSYVAKDPQVKSSPLRFKASQDARIEIYQLDGTPLAVDGAGNGSLLDAGDELFQSTDGAGHLSVSLTDGVAPLKIVAYPRGPIEADGLEIDIECFNGTSWILHSRNKIEP